MRSFLLITVGVIFVIVATTVVDVLLHGAGVYPPFGDPMNDALALLATSYRIVIGVLGGWLTAKFAPTDPMRHAIILGVVGTVLAFVGLVVTWDKALGPDWFPIALVVLAIPQSWLGGKLHQMTSRGTS